MRWLYLILLCAVLHTISAEPEPKKYKPEPATEVKKNLTDDERKFLREVEEKFGIKSDIPVDDKKTEIKSIAESKTASNDTQKPPFPAVIAIEIVNDTETISKGKRTIDANLGYGYRTNNGYSYSYFGKPTQDKGKFMIYPYSQEDIPAGHNTYSQHHRPEYSTGKQVPHASTSVEIQPSQAFELVSVKDENGGYDYRPPATQLSYDNVNTHTSGLHTKISHPSTLYTTYNGEGFSGLSGQFPSIMPNYFVEPTQLIKNPQYQSVGLTSEHLRTHGPQLERRVVPVLVLRIPSSYLKNPTAELYANLPNNYPLSQHLNSVNLQELVNQYFKKNGYSFAPQVMAYQTPVPTAQPVVSPNHEPHHYANPYVQPAYTHADYSGVQYSAVKPVMAKYPSSYAQQKYLVSPTKSLYRRPVQQQHYEYQYQYVPSTPQPQQSYYVQEQEYKTPETADASHQYQNEEATAEHQAGLHDQAAQVEYRTSQQVVSQEVKPSENEAPQNTAYQTHQAVPSYYGSPQAETSQYDHSQNDAAYTPQQVSQAQTEYSSSSSEYYSPKQTSAKQTITVYPSQLVHSENYQEHTNQNPAQQYVYQSENNDANHGLALSENYPTKDHTIATVLPFTYKQSRNPSVASVQTVSYVTPMPSARYQSQYKVMVPQTVLKNPESEKVSYVNSHSVSPQYVQPNYYSQESTAEQEYSEGVQYISPVASKTSYPRNYYGHPKRQAKPDSKAAGSATSSSTTTARKSQKSDKKKTA